MPKELASFSHEQESQIERYNKLLAKLEEQARRQDAIFEAEEKRLGIKQ